MRLRVVSTVRMLVPVFLLALMSGTRTRAQEKSSVWVSDPQRLIFNASVRPADWFDQDNAVLYRSHALDVIHATVGCRLAASGSALVPSSALGSPPTKLAGQLQGCAGNDTPTFPGPNDYVVIHVLRWKDPAEGSNAQSVDKQNWYVFHSDNKVDWDDDAYAKNNRIFGSKRVYLLYVHFNRGANSRYLARYTVTAKKKTPAYLLHFASLLQVYGASAGVGATGLTVLPGTVPNAFWNSTPLDTYYVPSDLTFAPTMLPYPQSSSSQATPPQTASATSVTTPVTPPAPGPIPPASAQTPAPATATSSSTLPPPSMTVPGGSNPQAGPPNPSATPAPSANTGSIPTEVSLDSQVFDNEGLYHFDFSVAVPIRKISEISYVSSSNSLVPSKVDKQTTFGVIDYYFKPIDIKGSGWSLYPHALAGVAIDSHPLKRVLIGGGYGPLLAHFYMGLVLDTQSLPPGASCGKIPTTEQLSSGALQNRICPGFSLGLNVSVGSVLDSLKSKSSTTSGSKAK